jgi:hypothetical protein
MYVATVLVSFQGQGNKVHVILTKIIGSYTGGLLLTNFCVLAVAINTLFMHKFFLEKRIYINISATVLMNPYRVLGSLLWSAWLVLEPAYRSRTL